MALAFGEQGHQHIRARDFFTSGILDVDDGALDYPLEPGGRLGVFLIIDRELGELVVDVFGQGCAQLVEIDVRLTV